MELDSEPTLDQMCTTKSDRTFAHWLHAYACGITWQLRPGFKPLSSWREYRERMRILSKVRKYKRDLKREPEARQIEIAFPLPKTNQLWLLEKEEQRHGAALAEGEGAGKANALLQQDESSQEEG